MHNEEKKHQEESATPVHKVDEKENEIVQPVEKKNDSFRINKKIALAILVVLLLLGIAYYAKSAVFAATVNGSAITRLEIMQGLERASGKAYVETIITEKLITGAAHKAGIKVTDEDINKEITRIEAGLTQQGATIEMLLSSQGLTLENLRKQLVLKKSLEGLLAEKVAVTEAEIDAYIAESKTVIDSATGAEVRANIMEQLRGQKLNKEAGAYIESLRSSAKIVFYGNYVPAPVALPVAQ